MHAPLAAILILLELTRNNSVVLPAMLASIIATGFARSIYPDSIYTLALRQRGVRLGATGDMMLLRSRLPSCRETIRSSVCSI